MAGGSHVGRVSNRSVHAAVHRLGLAAGMPGRHHPHRWRHAYATGLLRAGVSLEHIKRLLGHASITTTSRYLHLDLDDLTTAVNHTFDE